jgi:UDP-sulfoquinovose synthase
MSNVIVVLGHDGYIGHALTMRLLNKGYKVIGIDSELRRRSVEEMGSFSATPIKSMEDRAKAFQEMGDFAFYYGDISGQNGYVLLANVLQGNKPMAVVNLAQQPSAPYSQISVEHARRTANNNVASTINVVWAIREHSPESHLVQIGTMGEYDPALGRSIPEGWLTLPVETPVGKKERETKRVIFPRSGGSFYHTSKISATYFLEFVCRIWELAVTDIMQGIVYGNWTPEIEYHELHTRLDSDEAFGTVVNRFIVQTVLEHPLTVYGKGNHKRGFIALNDSVQCLMLAIENPSDEGYRVWNQLDSVHTMHEVAQMIKSAGEKHRYGPLIKKIPTPRVEITEDFLYDPVCEKLKALGFEPTRTRARSRICHRGIEGDS